MKSHIPKQRPRNPPGTRTNVCFTVVTLDGKKFRHRMTTAPKTLLTDSGMDALLEQEIERVEQFFPDREFRLVPLRNGNFNFIEIAAKQTIDAEARHASETAQHMS